MADARTPPSGPPARDPTAPARLLDAAAEVGLRVERAQRELDGLAGTTQRLADAAGVPARERSSQDPEGRPPGGPDPSGGTAPGGSATYSAARAFAIDLAVGGWSRAAIQDQLRQRFGLADPAALVAQVVRARPVASQPPSTAGTWSEPGSPPRPEHRSPPRATPGRPTARAPRPAGEGGHSDESAEAGDSDAEGDLPEGPAGAVPPDAGTTEVAIGDPTAAADGVPDAAEPPSQRGMLHYALQTYGAQVGTAVLALLNVLIVARALGVTGRGEVAFLSAIAFIGTNLWTLGVQEANVNLAGSEPATRPALATNSLILAALFGGVGALLIAGLIVLVPAAGAGVSWALLLVVLVSQPMRVLAVYLQFLIQGDYGFGVTNLTFTLPAIINVAVNGTLAVLGVLSVGAAVVTLVVGQTLATGILVWYVVRRSAGFGRPDVGLARRSLIFGVKSHIGRVMLVANYRIDQWLLGAIAGTKQLGQYSVAVAWAEALYLLPTALSAVQRPTVVRASPREAVRITARVFRWALLITAVMAAGIFVLAPFLCVTIFGEEFRGSVADLRILVFGVFGVVALKQLGNSLTGRNRPIHASLSIACAFVMIIVLDIVLIPEHGALGAAIAAAAAFTVGGLVIAIVFTRTLGGRLRDLVPRPSDISELRLTVRTVLKRRSRSKGVDGGVQAPNA